MKAFSGRWVVALSSGWIAAAAAAPPTPPAPPATRVLQVVGQPPLQEQLAPTEVSASLNRRAVYGLMAGSISQALDFPERGAGHPQVWVDAVGPRDQALCVDLARAQGGYEARFKVDLPPGSGPLRIPFDSGDAARKLFASTRATTAELVARVRPARGSSCDDTQPLLPAALGPQPAESGSLHLAVGGAGKGVPVVRVNQQAARSCVDIGRHLGRRDFGANVYGYLCPLVDAQQACQPSNSARVIWMEGGVSNEEVDVAFRRRCDAAR